MKYVCPKCRSELKYWEEYGFAKESVVNKLTGKLNKKLKKSNEYCVGTQGLTCINNNCRFEYNGNFVANKTKYDYLDEIFENIS